MPHVLKRCILLSYFWFGKVQHSDDEQGTENNVRQLYLGAKKNEEGKEKRARYLTFIDDECSCAPLKLHNPRVRKSARSICVVRNLAPDDTTQNRRLP